MTKSNPDFPQPPWVYGPTETMDWIEATHPSKKGGKKGARGRGHKKVRNMHVQFDLNVERTPVNKTHGAARFFATIGAAKVEEHFDLVQTAELLLRALAKAKFRHTGKIVIDDKVVSSHQGNLLDLQSAIEVITTSCPPHARTIEITAFFTDMKIPVALIHIKKIHRVKEHSIDIFFKGELEEELYHEFINYICEKLGVTSESLIT